MTYPAPPVAVKTATIANGATTSNVIDLEHWMLVGLIFGTFTGATISFTVSTVGDGTFVPLVDEAGAAISVVATDNSAVGLDAAARELAPWRFIKIVSASSEAAARTISLVLKA